MATRWVRVCALALLALVLAGCGEVPTVRQRQQADDLVIFLEHPERIAINREVALVVTVIDGEERTVSDAIVTLDLTMPEMPMGQNRPLADALGGGRYRALATYTMLGSWETSVLVSWRGGERRARFTMQVDPE